MQLNKLFAFLVMLVTCIYIVRHFLSNQKDSLISAYNNVSSKNVMTTFRNDHFKKSARRFLLFISAGDVNNVKQLIGGERNYDIVVVFNGNSTQNTRLNVDELYIRKDTKFPNLKWYIETHSIEKYDAVAVWNDDIVAPVEHINALFLEAITSNCDIFSPCHSKSIFPQLLKLRKDGVRSVNFIDMNAPIFLQWILKDFMVTYDPSIKASGIDVWYSYRCTHILDKCYMKVSDTTCVLKRERHRDSNQIEKVHENTWARFARDILHQPSNVPASAFYPGNGTNNIAWRTVCAQNLKENAFVARYTNFADKVGVKTIVNKSDLNITTPKTYAVVTNANDITMDMLNALPNEYVFKPNHGSAMTVIVKGNLYRCYGTCQQSKYLGMSKILQLKFLQINCEKWLSIDFGKIANEHYYSNIYRKCFFEEMISQNVDYKIYVFHGKPVLIDVHMQRFNGRYEAFYTPSWRKINIKKTILPTKNIEKPRRLKEMLQIAKHLSRDFINFVRVDMYLSNQTIFLSELTMFPDACKISFKPAIAEHFYGALAAGGNQDPESIIPLLQKVEDP